MQCACDTLSSVACPALQYFSALTNKRHDFRVGGGWKLLNTKCVFGFSLQRLSETFLILRRNKRDMTKMYIGLHAKHRCYSYQILIQLEFSRQIFENFTNIKFHGNPTSGSRVVPCGRTDMTKLIVAFRNFANAPNNYN
jgi:hypothetical protein